MEQETITPVKPEVNALQGTDITLSCNYKGDVNNLQWYRHYPGSRPECLLWILQSSMSVQNTSITTPRHTGRLNEEKTRVDLMISSVELEDSALYHCALQRGCIIKDPHLVYGMLLFRKYLISQVSQCCLSGSQRSGKMFFFSFVLFSAFLGELLCGLKSLI
uniref:Ig-like domain-containing protein n=1 Tax=Salmo trutta TaxID=8032 RepID=A0A674F3E9_SALTR